MWYFGGLDSRASKYKKTEKGKTEEKAQSPWARAKSAQLKFKMSQEEMSSKNKEELRGG